MPKGTNGKLNEHHLMRRVARSCGKEYFGKPDVVAQLIAMHCRVCKKCINDPQKESDDSAGLMTDGGPCIISNRQSRRAGLKHAIRSSESDQTHIAAITSF